MRLQYKFFFRNSIVIISFIAIILIQFISTKSTRDIESTKILNFYFSSITVFYSYGVIVSCFIALKYNLLKIFENKSLIIRYGDTYSWFNAIRINSNYLVLFIVMSFSITPIILGLFYRGIDINQLILISISILVQLLGLIIIDEIFNLIYIKNLNKLKASLITVALVILPEYIANFFIIKFNTLTNIIFIMPDNLNNYKYIIFIIIFNISIIVSIKHINRKILYSLSKKDIIFSE